MNIYIVKNSERQGPYSIEQVVGFIRKGEYLMSDLAWREGMADWQPIHTLADIVSAVLPPLPVEPEEQASPVTPPPIPEQQPSTPNPPTVERSASIAPGAHTEKAEQYQSESDKRILPAFLLSLFLGFVGIHAFYAGCIMEGIVFIILLLCGTIFQFFGETGAFIGFICTTVLGVFWLVAVFRTALGLYKDGNGRKITKWV